MVVVVVVVVLLVIASIVGTSSTVLRPILPIRSSVEPLASWLDTIDGLTVDVDDEDGSWLFDLRGFGSSESSCVDFDSFRFRLLITEGVLIASELTACLRFPMSSLSFLWECFVAEESVW